MNVKGKSLLVFTGGGETQALNATMCGIIQEARKKGIKVFGGLRGWEGILPEGEIVRLDTATLSGVENIGGSFLQMSRTNPFRSGYSVEIIKEYLKRKKIDFVLPIGGDDTLGAAQKLSQAGVPLVGVPKTRDNDLGNTYYTPGFPSAAEKFSQFVYEIKRDCAFPRNRVFIIEAQGGKAGWLAGSSCAGGADVIVIPEQHVNFDHFAAQVHQAYYDNGGFAVAVVAEETTFDSVKGMTHEQNDGYGIKRHNYVAIQLKHLLQKRMNADVQAIIPSSLVSSGAPSELDKVNALAIGRKAVQMLEEERFGQMPSLSYSGGSGFEIIPVPLSTVVGKSNYRSVPLDFYDAQQLKMTSQFVDYLKPCITLNMNREQTRNYDLLAQKKENVAF